MLGLLQVPTVGSGEMRAGSIPLSPSAFSFSNLPPYLSLFNISIDFLCCTHGTSHAMPQMQLPGHAHAMQSSHAPPAAATDCTRPRRSSPYSGLPFCAPLQHCRRRTACLMASG